MTSAITKFKVPMVGGHSHPDCEYNAVDVAILGSAKKTDVIYSHTASVGDDIIFAMDLDGSVHTGSFGESFHDLILPFKHILLHTVEVDWDVLSTGGDWY